MRPLALVTLLALTVQAEPIRVTQIQGAAQGFLVVRDGAGKQIGSGNLQQVARNGRITSRVVYTFSDGSVDDETTVFTQNRVFRVISDRHVQHGPLFEKPLDVAFETASGAVTTREAGKPEAKEHEKDIPVDVANGITGTILLNIKPGAMPFELPMIAPTEKGRLIKIRISSEGERTFTIAGISHKADIYRVHPELGGLTGAIAPVVGKQPKDAIVWVARGESPVIVREVSQLSNGGPVLSIELAGAHFEPVGAEAVK